VAIVETIEAGTQTDQLALDGEEAQAMAEQLAVPVALIWLAMALLPIDDIDALCAWWPRKKVD
jgi:hypothetical protein